MLTYMLIWNYNTKYWNIDIPQSHPTEKSGISCLTAYDFKSYAVKINLSRLKYENQWKYAQRHIFSRQHVQTIYDVIASTVYALSCTPERFSTDLLSDDIGCSMAMLYIHAYIYIYICIYMNIQIYYIYIWSYYTYIVV